MTISIDSSVFVDVLRKKQTLARNAFSSLLASGEPLVASYIVYHELVFGAELHNDKQGQLKNVRLALQQVEIERFELRDMIEASHIRAHLRRAGLGIGSFDLLVAAQALARGWKVLTGNVREFRRVTGLEVIDWKSSILDHSGTD